MRIFLLIGASLFLLPWCVRAEPADRAALEAQLAELERQISAYEDTIESYRKQGTTLSGEIKRIDAETKKLNLEIKAVTLSIAKLDQEITKNKIGIQAADAKLAFNRRALGGAMQALYEAEKESLVEILMQNLTLASFFSNVNGLLFLQDDLKGVVRDTEAARAELVNLKEELALKKMDTTELKAARASQKKKLDAKKSEKHELLAKTKGQEKEYQKLLTETKKTAAQIRSRIFEFLGGGQLTFEQAYKIAKNAADLAGIRPALLLAVLDRESALGKNVGRCSYRTAMHPTRDTPLFLELTSALGLDPEKMLVSCANADGAYGGAMGVSQFIPSTWNMYAARVRELTGNNPPSPWRHADAFVATALYLKDAGAGADRNTTVDRQAAARYYAGRRWRSYLWTYGERVVAKAKQFEEDITAMQAAGVALQR